MGRSKKETMLGSEEHDDHWIQRAIKHPNALHKTLHVPEGEKIPLKKLNKASHSRDLKTRRRANLAKTLRSLHH